nr:hypothetical protein [Variovorax terrae]
MTLAESELLILHVAAHYRCVGEQQIHEPIAQQTGLSDEVLAAIRANAPPPLGTARQRLLAEVANELLTTKKLSAALYERAVRELGERTLIEVVGILGYYALVAYTLNAFEMRLE